MIELGTIQPYKSNHVAGVRVVSAQTRVPVCVIRARSDEVTIGACGRYATLSIEQWRALVAEVERLADQNQTT